MPNDDYIKRSDAIKALYQGYERLGLIVYRVSCIEKINKIPAADVEPKRRWIPVTERLPEELKFVLVFSKFVKMETDCISNDGNWYSTPGVTHWMPLPEPPKEEDDA